MGAWFSWRWGSFALAQPKVAPSIVTDPAGVWEHVAWRLYVRTHTCPNGVPPADVQEAWKRDR